MHFWSQEPWFLYCYPAIRCPTTQEGTVQAIKPCSNIKQGQHQPLARTLAMSVKPRPAANIKAVGP